MRRLALFLALVAGVLACDRPTGPRRFVLGPGCELSRYIEGIGTARARYADCFSLNTDSLTADGWTVTWDTTYVE